jgi:3-oxoadipate enol-lactonase
MSEASISILGAGSLGLLYATRLARMGRSVNLLVKPEKVSSLILCDTACKIPQETHQDWEERIAAARRHGMAALADGTMQRWLSPEFQKAQPDIAEKIRNMILATPVAGFAGCCRAIRDFDVKNKIGRISVPVLILVGENDPGTPVEMSQEIRDAISGAEMVTLPQSFHLSNIEAAEPFNQTVTDFLAKQ